MNRMKELLMYAAAGALAVFVARALTPKDDTDPPNGRSGMVLRTDALTGCQYLATPGILGHSALTPRLDEYGNHVCSKAVVP